jgi:hypothetical protein
MSSELFGALPLFEYAATGGGGGEIEMLRKLEMARETEMGRETEIGEYGEVNEGVKEIKGIYSKMRFGYYCQYIVGTINPSSAGDADQICCVNIDKVQISRIFFVRA